jgi:hypothetical protein
MIPWHPHRLAQNRDIGHGERERDEAAHEAEKRDAGAGPGVHGFGAGWRRQPRAASRSRMAGRAARSTTRAAPARPRTQGSLATGRRWRPSPASWCPGRTGRAAGPPGRGRRRGPVRAAARAPDLAGSPRVRAGRAPPRAACELQYGSIQLSRNWTNSHSMAQIAANPRLPQKIPKTVPSSITRPSHSGSSK